MNETELRQLKRRKDLGDKRQGKKWAKFDRHCCDLLYVLDLIQKPIVKKSWWSGTRYHCPKCEREISPHSHWSKEMWSGVIYDYYKCACGYEYLVRREVNLPIG